MYRGVMRALVTGPQACVPLPKGLTLTDLDGHRWLAGWDAPEGPLVTLTGWAAERLGDRTVYPPRPLQLIEPTEGVYRWATPDDPGPPPRQPRERPYVVHPKRTDWIRAIDWRLEALIEQARKGVEPLLVVLELGRPAAVEAPGALQGGLGPKVPGLDPAERKLLLEAERARKAREKAAKRRRRRRA